MTASSVTTIGSLIAATKFMEWETIRKAAPKELGAESFARDAARTLLGMNHHAYKYLAFHTLQLMAKPLVLDDGKLFFKFNKFGFTLFLITLLIQAVDTRINCALC